MIQSALEIVGAKALGQPLDNDEIEQGGRFLSDLVKSWQSKGVFLWSIYDLQTNISLSDVSFDLQADTDHACIDIDTARVVDGDRDYPLTRISYSKYLDLPEKTTTGRPLYYTVSTSSDYDLTTVGVSKPTCYFYPAADATYVLKYRGISLLKDLDENTSSPDIRRRLINALKYALAADLADPYHLSISEREYLTKKAAFLFQEAKASDRDRDDTECSAGVYDYSRR